jgi:NodT family efflux transporter outer membrane factor (OMF) lipoprotein
MESIIKGCAHVRVRRAMRIACRIQQLCPLRICAAVFSAAALVTGCAVGPDFVHPAAPGVNSYVSEPLAAHTASADVAGGAAQHFVQSLDIPGQWWTLFHSAPLNALIEQALKANPTLQGAEAALRVAQETVYAQQGAYFPTIQANFTPTRQKVANNLSSPVSSGATIFNLHTAQVLVSYTADVFGGNRRQVESLQAQAESQRFQLEAAYLTLTSNVVAAAVQEALLRGQIAATEELIKLETEQLDLLHRQLDLGSVAEAAVVAQEATLAQAQAALPPLRKQLAQQRDLLSALAGRFPSEELAEEFDLSTLQLPQELPVSLPSKLVEQRPDVRAAEAQLHAASAQIGVAVANMLPQINLNASGGSVATQMADLFKSGSGFWNVAGSLTQPIFEGGTLLHKKRAAEAAYDQAAAQYRSTVIAAFQDVSDTLHALQYDADALHAVVTAEHATKKNLDIARRQFELGDISYLALLTAEQAYQQTVINRLQVQANRYTDTAALFQALGGGWWNRSDVDGKVRQP